MRVYIAIKYSLRTKGLSGPQTTFQLVPYREPILDL